MQSPAGVCAKVKSPVDARKLLKIPALVRRLAAFFNDPSASSTLINSRRTISLTLASTGKRQQPAQQFPQALGR
jgi:hypothetical protein